MYISIIDDLQARGVHAEDVVWEQLVARCANPTLYANKTDMPLIKLATFGMLRTSSGSLRHNANITAITGVECDYDGERVTPSDAAAILQAYGISAIVYTTSRHTSTTPRWRVLVELSQPILPEYRTQLTAMVNGVLGGILADESFTLSQSYYIGSVVGSEYECYVCKGQPLDTIPALPEIYPKHANPQRDIKPSHDVTAETIAEIKSALTYINSDNRDTWISVGQALASLGDAGFQLWDDWSKTSPKYDASDMWRWQTFSADRTDFRAIFSKAQAAGWINPRLREPINTAEIFGSQERSLSLTANRPLDMAMDDMVFPHALVSKTGKKILNTYENLLCVMRDYGIECYYDEVLKKQYMIIPGMNHFENDCSDNGKLQILKSILSLNNCPDAMSERLAIRFMTNVVNPVRNWITGTPWDGVSRIEKLCMSVGVRDEDVTYRNWVMKMWLIQCVAALDGGMLSPIPHKKHKYETVLVFRGEQGKFKTSFIQSLVPELYSVYVKDGIQLDTRNKDSVKNAVSCWIGEFGELDGTFKRTHIAHLKSFLSSGVDELRLPYDRLSSHFQRRASFCASVNEKRFLADTTGNRRFPVLDVINGNYRHGIDMQQLWAEVWELYAAGAQWWPTVEQAKEIALKQMAHAKVNHVEDAISTVFDLSIKPTVGVRYTCSEILNECKVQHNYQNVSEVKALLESLGFEYGTYNGKRGYRLEHIKLFNH